MEYTRILKKGMTGKDVLYIKNCLFNLNYYTSNIKQIKSNSFGSDTVKAVEKYQSKNKDLSGEQLKVDGIIGRKTWYAIERDLKQNDKNNSTSNTFNNATGLLDKYTHISADKRKKIEEDLANVSDIRKNIVLEILNYAYDKDISGDVRALYIFGANLYNTNLEINFADEAEIKKYSERYPNYFNGGRKEWMLKQVARNPKLPASDCSGMEVGYLRKYKLVDKNFDTTANNFTTSKKYSTTIKKEELKPGDWVGLSGHIGTYVGGGFVVEFYGGAYGCQLTDLNNRRGYDFITKRIYTGKAWTRFCRPTFY